MNGGIEAVTVGEIVTAISVISVLVMAYSNVKKAVKEQTKPVREFEERLEKCEEHLDNDNKRLMEIEKCNRLILRATRALLKEASIDNDKDGKLSKISGDIDTYLEEK